MTRRNWFAALIPGAASAQITNSRATLSSDQMQVLLLTPQGPQGASIGAGLAVTASPGKLSISAQPNARIAHRAVTVAADGTVTAPGLVTLIRNGIVLTEGVDYERTTTGARLTAQGFEPGDNWSAFVQ